MELSRRIDCALLAGAQLDCERLHARELDLEARHEERLEQLSRELRDPLYALCTAGEVLKPRELDLDPALARAAAAVQRQATRMLEIIARCTERSAEVRSREPAASDALRVLVVDDSVDAADTLAIILERKGYRITTAHDGASAITAFARTQPDLVLLDLGLPDIDGYAVANAMHERDPRPILIALTGFGDPQTQAAVERSCFARHLLKPLDFGTLDELLSAARAQLTAPR